MLSLDVVAGALASLLLSTQVLEVEVSLGVWLILPVTVWFFYTSDHLLDALGSSSVPQSARHFLHHKSFPYFVGTLSILLPVLLFVVFRYLSMEVLIGGFLLGAFVVVYFTIVFVGRRKGWMVPKEIFIAMLYTAGTWGPAIVQKQFELNTGQFLLLLVFALLVLIEGMTAAWYDYDLDIAEQHPSFVRWLNKVWANYIVNFLLIVTIGLIFLYTFSSENEYFFSFSILFLMMALVLSVVLNFPSFFAHRQRFRLVGEAVFCFPFLLLVEVVL